MRLASTDNKSLKTSPPQADPHKQKRDPIRYNSSSSASVQVELQQVTHNAHAWGNQKPPRCGPTQKRKDRSDVEEAEISA